MGLMLAALSLSLAYRAYRQQAVAEERAIRSPDGIDSLQAVRIGGIDQWIHVRGEHVGNPILLFIHGGPGQASIATAREYQRAWEAGFTVVQWDQRGAGKTYATNDRELQRRTMTVPRMQQDALEVVNYLRGRFKRDKIFVMGVSWGTVLGLWLAHEHPEGVAAYVGVAQMIDATLTNKTAYDDALAAARLQRRDDAVKELESIQPYPTSEPDPQKTQVAQTWQAQMLGPPVDGTEYVNIPRILGTVLTAPEYSLRDVYGLTRGQVFSIQVLVPQMRNLDLATLGPDFDVPLFFFHGRLDPYIRPQLIEAYARTITAPRHEIVWFERAGHFPFYEDRERFVEELSRVLKPETRSPKPF
jgi:pimeloyl-ACP methyl ester carboxylesterase